MVMVLRAVSAPMLKSEPGTLLETVAGMTQMGMQSSSYLALPSISSRLPTKACGNGGVRGMAQRGAPQPPATPPTSKPPMMISPWMPKLVMVALISSKYFLGKVLAEAWDGEASGGGLRLGPRTQTSTGQRYLFVPSLDPPRPVQSPTVSQLISSTWPGERSGGKAALRTLGWEAKGFDVHRPQHAARRCHSTATHARLWGVRSPPTG